MIDAARYRQERYLISSAFLTALRMKEYLFYDHNLSYRHALEASNKDLGWTFEPTGSLDEWFKEIWESWERYLKQRPVIQKRMFLLAGEAGLLVIEYKDIPNEIWKWLKETDEEFYDSIQASWPVYYRKRFMNLFRMGWEVNGEHGALICIKPHFFNTYEMLNNATIARKTRGSQEQHEALTYEPGQCPTCANPRCTGPHSFFHLM